MILTSILYEPYFLLLDIYDIIVFLWNRPKIPHHTLRDFVLGEISDHLVVHTTHTKKKNLYSIQCSKFMLS